MEDRNLVPTTYNCKTLSFRRASSLRFHLILQGCRGECSDPKVKMTSGLTLGMISGMAQKSGLLGRSNHSQYYSLVNGFWLLAPSNYQISGS